jgi:hypothetical protein
MSAMGTTLGAETTSPALTLDAMAYFFTPRRVMK